MRIALVTSEYPDRSGGSGGLAAYVQRTARALRDQAHEPVVFTPAATAAAGEDDGVPVISVAGTPPRILSACDLLTLHRGAVPLALLLPAWRLEQAVRALHRDRPFDVVHYAGINGLGMFRGHLPAIARASCHRPSWSRFGDGSARGWHAWLHQRIELAALRRMDLVCAPSRAIAQLVSEDLGRDVPVLPNPWTPWLTPTAALPDQLAGRAFVLFAGTLSPLKGARVIAAAMRMLTSAHPGLLLATAGRRTRDGNAALAGLVPVVDLGLLDRPTLRAAMRAAVAVIVPSLLDNLPNTALEAMAEGAPVIASSGIGLEDVDGGRGLAACIPPGDAAALATAISGCLALSSTQRERIALLARNAIATLAPERTIPPLIAFYQQALSARP
jgi:glycosyltransferase involved in cell wall biosynthesis